MKQPTGHSTLPLFSCHAVHIRSTTENPLRLPDVALPAGQVLDLGNFNAPVRAGLMQLITARHLPLSGKIGFGGIDAGFWPDEELDRYRCVLRPRAQQQRNGMMGSGISHRTELNLQQAFEFTAFAERLQQQLQSTRIVVLDGVLDFLDSVTRRIALQFLSDHIQANRMAAISCPHAWRVPNENYSGQANNNISMPITTTRISIGRPSRQ